MRDPNDFTVPFQELIDSLEDRVRHGVEQPASIIFFFKRAVTSYELPQDAFAVTRVTGMVDAKFTVFEEGRHYSFSGNRLGWINANVRPDEGSRLEVEYTFRDLPSGLTDFNPGSVAGTLIRAAARELTLLYDQMDQAYRRAFIDQANGIALDNVVALLGVTRNPAQKAEGQVTFFRKKPPDKPVDIAKNTRVADQSGRVFVTVEEGRIPVADPRLTEEERRTRVWAEEITANHRVKNLIGQIIGVWPKGSDPETAAPLAAVVDGGDERAIKSAPDPASPLPDGDLLVRYIPRSVTVAIEALEAGPDGNVNAGTITIMPTPPSGVDGVTNEERTTGGMEAEPDDLLRERAKHALERAGNATLNAIKFAVLDVDGVQGVEVLDHQTDDAIPLGEVRVRFSGGDREKVSEAVEQTRAAGIIARLDEIIEVLISGDFYLLPGSQVPDNAPARFMEAVVDAMQSLTIGAPLVVRRINALVYNVTGLADVAEAQLSFRKRDPAKPNTFIEDRVTDSYLTQSTEMVRPDKARLEAKILIALQAIAHRKSGADIVIDMQITDATGAVKFRSFTIDLRVTALARLKNQPDQLPERIGSFNKSVSFAESATAQLSFAVAQEKIEFKPEIHESEVEFVIAAAAFPGLQETRIKFDITG
ncbi:MAG TPA: baseplate J/gp47 family protein [Blastocatellia bacterium]|nr:baseplate J/gp47 family protein [Blastocatellia bacterium]